MKRWIHANSEVGHHKGVAYGREESGEYRYYFRDKDGQMHFTDNEADMIEEIEDYIEEAE